MWARMNSEQVILRQAIRRGASGQSVGQLLAIVRIPREAIGYLRSSGFLRLQASRSSKFCYKDAFAAFGGHPEAFSA